MNFDHLDTFLGNLKRRGKAGTDCAVYLEGNLIHRHVQNYADVENAIPIREDTIYRMFSMTKPITCIAALQLYEQGYFLLSDAVSDYLPEFSKMLVQRRKPNNVIDLVPAQKQITIQQLFTMTAGLTYSLDTPELTDLYREKQSVFTTREYVKAISKASLAFEPGDHWLYSLCHDVLGALIEVLSDMSFGEYLTRYIFDPLGMKDAYFHVPQNEINRCAYQYSYDSSTETFHRDWCDTICERGNIYQRGNIMESGGAGLSMTVNDYALFANMLCAGGRAKNGKRIIASSTLNLLRENQLTKTQQQDFNWIQLRGYGYGLGVRTLINRCEAGSAGALGECGWAGASGTYFLVDPQNDLVIVYAQQATPNDEIYVQPRLRNLVYSSLEY
jgi:CubicO group peptidase (beta-lactamase class C family)